MAFQVIEEEKIENLGDNFEKAAIKNNLNRLCNQIYSLLPKREEGKEYIKPLETIYIELVGMAYILLDYQEPLLALVCKLKGLHVEGEEVPFKLYRRTVFECCSLIGSIKEAI